MSIVLLKMGETGIVSWSVWAMPLLDDKETLSPDHLHCRERRRACRIEPGRAHSLAGIVFKECFGGRAAQIVGGTDIQDVRGTALNIWYR